MRKVNKRCQYICSIHDVDGKPEFRIAAQEEGYKEHVVKAPTAHAAWYQILEAISRLRNCAQIIKVFPKYITGEDLFGLTEPSIVKVCSCFNMTIATNIKNFMNQLCPALRCWNLCLALKL